MVKKIQINFGNKTFYTLIAITVLLIGAGVVYAYNSGNPSVHGHDANEIANLPSGGGMNVIWEGSLPAGSGWRCLDVPIEQCGGRGCFLKFKTIYSTGSIYAYSGIIDYDSTTKWASFSSEADGDRLWRWNVNDGVHGGAWAHSALLWLGDCKLTSGGTCESGTNDNIHLCAYIYNLDALLIKY